MKIAVTWIVDAGDVKYLFVYFYKCWSLMVMFENLELGQNSAALTRYIGFTAVLDYLSQIK